ncbi:hypothetical protein NPS42_24205 [Pseudomonas putida]|uniref:hypothetical protein n=1 Tax=Pseudomonas putida TaxID=303 RepID=UPI000A111CC3|nr:hypothetical protein [Pseudomonas putida]MDD2028895.1 hypothetical protein [Pseudomonas putida]ORL66438.1 hypothetical protein B7H19_20570 [Pseudomonas putida]HDS1769672.1 hypothetical protein [Pseudomonas putida]
MSSEDRLYFESVLQEELRGVASKFDGVVASKNKLKFKYNKKNVAELFLDYLARVDSYVLAGIVFGGELFEYASKFTPPYKSNLLSDGCFSFISSGEQSKRFSGEFGGAIRAPAPVLAGEVCTHIRLVLEEFYVPQMLAAIVPTDRTISDVVLSPGDYSYPAVLIHCAAKLGGLAGNEVKIKEAMSSKKIVKCKAYDVPLLGGLL